MNRLKVTFTYLVYLGIIMSAQIVLELIVKGKLEIKLILTSFFVKSCLEERQQGKSFCNKYFFA